MQNPKELKIDKKQTVIFYSFGENILDKSTKLSNIGFSVELFQANFSQLST